MLGQNSEMFVRNLWRRLRAPHLSVTIDEGEGAPVVLIHGIAASSATFSALVPLVTDNHRVIAIDLMGFGASPAPSDALFTIAEHTRAVERAVRSLGLRQPFVIVGHSLGALIAARFAAENPRMVRGLVMVSPPVYIPVDSLPPGINRSAMRAYGRVYDFLRANRNFTMASARWLSRVLPLHGVLSLTDSTWRAFSLSLQNAIQSQTTVVDVATTRSPVEVIYGTLDAVVVPAAMDLLATLRHVSVTPVVGGDHLIHGALARQVAASVERLSAAPVPQRRWWHRR